MIKVYSLLFLSIISLLSCNRISRDGSHGNTKVATIDKAYKVVSSVTSKNCMDIVHYDSIKVDTMIGDVHITYLIHDIDETVSTRSYDENGLSFTTNFADRSILINVKRKDKSILLNRTITKKDFTSIISNQNISKYQLSAFEITGINKDGINFFVNLCVPDTDDCCPVDLMITFAGRFSIKKMADSEYE